MQDAGHHLHLEGSLGLDASGLAHDPVHQLGLVLLHQRGDLAQDAGALVVRRRRPARLCRPRLGSGVAHVLGGGVADAGDHCTGRGLQDIERAADRGLPLRAEQAAAPHRFDENPRYGRVHVVVSSRQSPVASGATFLDRRQSAEMSNCAWCRDLHDARIVYTGLLPGKFVRRSAAVLTISNSVARSRGAAAPGLEIFLAAVPIMRGGGAPKGANNCRAGQGAARTQPGCARLPALHLWRFLIRVRLLPPSAFAPKAVARAPRGRAIVPDSRFHGPPESTVASRGRRTPNLAPYSGSPLETAPR